MLRFARGAQGVLWGNGPLHFVFFCLFRVASRICGFCAAGFLWTQETLENHSLGEKMSNKQKIFLKVAILNRNCKDRAKVLGMWTVGWRSGPSEGIFQSLLRLSCRRELQKFTPSLLPILQNHQSTSGFRRGSPLFSSGREQSASLKTRVFVTFFTQNRLPPEFPGIPRNSGKKRLVWAVDSSESLFEGAFLVFGVFFLPTWTSAVFFIQGSPCFVCLAWLGFWCPVAWLHRTLMAHCAASLAKRAQRATASVLTVVPAHGKPVVTKDLHE